MNNKILISFNNMTAFGAWIYYPGNEFNPKLFDCVMLYIGYVDNARIYPDEIIFIETLIIHSMYAHCTLGNKV